MKIRMLSTVLILFAISAVFFIHFTNDHKECFNTQETLQMDNGEEVKIDKHICNEKFNL